MMMKMGSICGVLLAGLLAASPAAGQSQFQSTFELGVGYTRPATENYDMVSLLLQADEFFLESGIGFRTNSGADGNTVFSWLVRGGARPFRLGNVIGHVGAEFDLHTNSTLDDDGNASTQIGLGFLVGGSYQLADHLNFAVHVYPLMFEFGGVETVSKVLLAEFGAHLMF